MTEHCIEAPAHPLRVVAPLTVGPGNAVLVTGLPWRWLRDFARRSGVPVWHVGSKSAIPAQQLLAALQREAEQQGQPRRELTFDEELALGRAALGMKLRPRTEAGR
jgi:hypothetical protein